jgi:hypothetical protein
VLRIVVNNAVHEGTSGSNSIAPDADSSTLEHSSSSGGQSSADVCGLSHNMDGSSGSSTVIGSNRRNLLIGTSSLVVGTFAETAYGEEQQNEASAADGQGRVAAGTSSPEAPEAAEQVPDSSTAAASGTRPRKVRKPGKRQQQQQKSAALKAPGAIPRVKMADGQEISQVRMADERLLQIPITLFEQIPVIYVHASGHSCD